MKTTNILILIATLTITGCATKWTAENEPTPYIAANQLAVSQTRSVQNLTTLMNPTGYRYESRWTDGKKIKLHKNKVKWEIEDYLLKTVYYSNLKKSNSNTVGYGDFGTVNNKINEHRLYLISLHPTVVIMVPIQAKFVDKIPGTLFGKMEMLGTPDGKILGFTGLVEGVYSGGEVPFQDEIMWFAPTVTGEPILLDKKTDVTREISVDNCHLLLIKDGNILKVERTN